MTEYEQFKTLIKEVQVRYFKNHFINKNIDIGMYESTEEIILELSGTAIKISLLIDCLCTIRKNKNYFQKLDKACQKRIKINIIGLKVIRKELDNILKPIIQGLQVE